MRSKDTVGMFPIARRTVYGTLVLVLAGCGFGKESNVDGPYYLVAIDAPNDMSVSYRVGQGGYVERIPPTVFAVGWNQEYLVAKRHPNGHSSVTQYYYLIRGLDSMYAEPRVSVRGPLSKQEFELVKRENDLPDFALTLKDLE